MKNTKKSLIASGVSLAVSVALLAGSTFAWFTDSVTNKGNKIQAGNLSIGAYSFDLNENGDKTFTIQNVNGGNPFTFETEPQNLNTDDTAIINDTDWEPGKSNAKLLQVVNEGTLAAEIKLDFETSGELTDALWFDFIKVENGQDTGRFEKRPMNTLSTFAQALELPIINNGESLQFILVYGMYDTAGNDYQGKTFTADVTIYAKQYTYEKDGFGSSDYDETAEYYPYTYVGGEAGNPLSTQNFAKVINNPQNKYVKLTTDAVIDDNINVYNDVFINLNEKKIISSKTMTVGRNDSYANVPAHVTLENGELVVSGSSGKIRAEDSCEMTFKNITFSSADENFRQALQVYASKKDSKNIYVFENCIFDNTYVAFEGSSGKSYEYEVRFINCKFTGIPGNGGAAVALDDYVYGVADFINCSFDITANGNATAAVSATTYPAYVGDKKMTVNLTDITFIGTSKETYFGTKTPVMLSVRYPEVVDVTESGECVYTTDGVRVDYSGDII